MEEAAIRSAALWKKLFLKISQYSQESTCVGVCSLIKLPVFAPVTLLKRDSNTAAYLWTLGNF